MFDVSCSHPLNEIGDGQSRPEEVVFKLANPLVSVDVLHHLPCVIAVVGPFPVRNFGHDNMQLFRDVCSELSRRTDLADEARNMVHQLKFGDPKFPPPYLGLGEGAMGYECYSRTYLSPSEDI